MRTIKKYHYRDKNGVVQYNVHRVERTVKGKRKKKFPVYQPNRKVGYGPKGPILYNLPELITANDQHIFITEGEKDADNVSNLGFVATTNVGGCGKWREQYNKYFQGRRVVIAQDNSDDGKAHGRDVANNLLGVAKSVTLLPPFEGYNERDISDWIKEDDGDRKKLLKLITQTKPITDRIEVKTAKKGKKKIVCQGERSNTLLNSYIGLAYQGLTRRQLLTLALAENKTYDPPMDEKEVRDIVNRCWNYAHSPQQPTTDMRDVSNSKEFAEFLQGTFRYCYSYKKWAYDDGMRLNFSTDEQGRITEAAKQFVQYLFRRVADCDDPTRRKELSNRAKRAATDNGIKGMISLTKSDPTVTVRADALDADNHLFNCRNGTVDLRTGILHRHNPANLITKLAPVDYPATIGHKAVVKKGKIRTWLRCLRQWMCNSKDNINYLQRAGGYFLTGDIRSRVFAIYWGGGKNGKSTFLETLMGIMGDYGDVATRTLLEITKMEQHPVEMMDLKGKRLIVASEPKRTIVLDSGKLKAMTGDKWGKGRAMYKGWERFPYTHKVVLVTNSKPTVRETTDAVWDRLHLINWKYRIPPDKEDHYLPQKLEKEWPYILGWLVAGCLRWRIDGHLKPTADIIAVSKQFRTDSDVLGAFCTDCIVFGSGSQYRVPRTHLYDRYKWWAVQQGVSERYWVSRKTLDSYLEDKGCFHKYSRRRGESSMDCWVGIALRDDDESPI
jgi:putative DNA primase/helicase